MPTAPRDFMGLIRLLISLSTGAVVITAAFLHDVFPEPRGRLFLAIAMGSFALCILGAVSTLLKVVQGIASDEAKQTFDWGEAVRPFQLTLISFTIGVSTMAAFIIWNLMS
jgi:hypothetical protein